MAFINPNTISNISREEFEELKERVNEIDLKLNNIVKPNVNHNIEETIINSSNEFNEYKDVYEIREDINIYGAKLNGIPRIEYFNFTKSKKASDAIEQNSDSNIINLSDILSNENSNKVFSYKTENIPVTAKTSSGHRTALINESKLTSLKNAYYGDIKKIAA